MWVRQCDLSLTQDFMIKTFSRKQLNEEKTSSTVSGRRQCIRCMNVLPLGASVNPKYLIIYLAVKLFLIQIQSPSQTVTDCIVTCDLGLYK